MKVFRPVKTEAMNGEQIHTTYNSQCHLSWQLREQTATAKMSRDTGNEILPSARASNRGRHPAWRSFRGRNPSCALLPRRGPVSASHANRSDGSPDPLREPLTCAGKSEERPRASVPGASPSFGTRAEAEMSPQRAHVLFLPLPHPLLIPPVRTEGRPFARRTPGPAGKLASGRAVPLKHRPSSSAGRPEIYLRTGPREGIPSPAEPSRVAWQRLRGVPGVLGCLGSGSGSALGQP